MNRHDLEILGFKGLNLNLISSFLFNEEKQTLAVINKEGITRFYKFTEIYT